MSTIVDVTERRQIEAQLVQAQKMVAIGDLVSGIAHDFNNILLGVLGYAELAKGDVGMSQCTQAHLDVIIDCAKRGRDLVERILTIGRKGHAERRAIQWEPVIRDALKLIRFALPTNIKIDVQVDPRVPAVWAHPIELQQIFMNLVINSIHASTETGGTIYAQVAMPDIDDDYLAAHAESRSNKQVCLNVIDQGSGMSSDVLEHVFEPFFTTRKATEGTGLGLSIVHQIVKRLGGTIVVKSSLGKGTHVSVCLPASDINAASLRQNDESANNPQLK